MIGPLQTSKIPLTLCYDVSESLLIGRAVYFTILKAAMVVLLDLIHELHLVICSRCFPAPCRNLPHRRMLTIQMSFRGVCIWVFPADCIYLGSKQSHESCQRASVSSEYKNQAAKPQAWAYSERVLVSGFHAANGSSSFCELAVETLGLSHCALNCSLSFVLPTLIILNEIFS